MLDARNLIHMLQAHGAHVAYPAVPCARARAARRRGRAVRVGYVVVGARDVARAADLALLLLDLRGGEEEGCRRRRAYVEGKGAVGADGYACGDGRARYELGGAGVEFLDEAGSC
jgi:hypothetical protein